jgi:hypothetical protein
VWAAIAGGWQVNNILSFYSGTPFRVTASGTSLNSPGSTQMADQINDHVATLGGIGRNNAYFDPLAFAPVTEARFGNSPRSHIATPGPRSVLKPALPGRSTWATGRTCSSAWRGSM